MKIEKDLKERFKDWRIDSNRCWCCGIEFTEENFKTGHHAIPATFKPLFNLCIPICKKCHDKIHLKMLHIASVKTKIIGLEKYVKELRELSEK